MAGVLGTGWRLTLLGPADVRLLADRLGIRPTKQRGQNFVIDANTVRRIVAKSGVVAGEQVLEVGPGLGSLTLGLLDAGAHVIAVELDTALAGGLAQTVAEYAPERSPYLTVVPGDALRVEIPGAPTAVVANLPYNVAVPVLLRLWETVPTIERALVMVQLEVAERLAAGPGTKVYGVPSVKAAWYADVRIAGHIGRTVFWPMPNVDSALVLMERREPPESVVGRERVFQVVDAAFAQRRKMLRSALAGLAPDGAAERALVTAGVDPTARAERLSVTDFARVADGLATAP